MNVQPWYRRLYNRLLTRGISPRDAYAMVKGSGKHACGKQQKPRNLDHKRKTRRLMGKASRRINRRQR